MTIGSFLAFQPIHQSINRLSTPTAHLQSWAKDRVDLEVIGIDSALYHKWWTASGWSSFEKLGGTFRNETPAALSFSDRSLHLWGCGSDSALWHKYYDGVGGWQPISLNGQNWTSLGGVCMTPPVVVNYGGDKCAAFVIGTDRGCWMNTITGNGAGTCTTSVESSSATLCALFHGYDRIDVFGIGTKSEFLYNWYSGEDLGGVCIGKPKAVSARDRRLDIFVKGMDSSMYHKCFNGSWNDWQRLGGTHLYEPDAVCWDNNRIDVFSVSTDLQLTHVWANILNNEKGDFNGNLEKLGTTCTGSPKALARAPNILDIFVKGTKQQVLQKAWNGSSWNPSGAGLYDLVMCFPAMSLK